jgi:hypothetical protein
MTTEPDKKGNRSRKIIRYSPGMEEERHTPVRKFTPYQNQYITEEECYTMGSSASIGIFGKP